MLQKLIGICSLLTLVACDRPSSDVDLTCILVKGFHTDTPTIITDSDSFTVNVKTYDDTATVSIDGQHEVFTQIRIDDYDQEYYSIEYDGIFPGTDKNAWMGITLNTANKMIVGYDLRLIEHDVGVGYYCVPIKSEYKAQGSLTKVPYKSKLTNFLD